MQETLQTYFGVFRSGDSLKEGVEKLQALCDPLQRVSVDDDYECAPDFRLSDQTGQIRHAPKMSRLTPSGHVGS
jgi:succinate dehydrogenase/fumarate reductase flavoprotein subunit